MTFGTDVDSTKKLSHTKIWLILLNSLNHFSLLMISVTELFYLDFWNTYWV